MSTPANRTKSLLRPIVQSGLSSKPKAKPSRADSRTQKEPTKTEDAEKAMDHQKVSSQDETECDLSGLPSHFKSLYRLVLRAASASVMHTTPACTHLQSRYRPMFDEAARLIRVLQCHRSGQDLYIDRMQAELKEFNERIDNTLTFLHNSAISRGLPHRVTKNLAIMVDERERIAKQRLYGTRPWNPNLPFDSPVYKSSKELAVRALKERRMLARAKRENAETWGMYDEVTRFAEARSKLILGREPVREGQKGSS